MKGRDFGKEFRSQLRGKNLKSHLDDKSTSSSFL